LYIVKNKMAILTIWVHDRFTNETDTDSTNSTDNLIKPDNLIKLRVSTGETITNIFSKWSKYFKYN
jgi:hypothetical protein